MKKGTKCMRTGQARQGFTIVELLIVVVIIAILAAITIVAYNGINNSARESAVAAELTEANKKVMNAMNASGTNLQPVNVLASGLNEAKFNTNNYKVVTYCASANDSVFAVETKDGQKYYKRAGAKMVKDNAMDAFLPCVTAGVSGAHTTYLNLPSQCAIEQATCNFTGTATIVYGSVSQGRFSRALNQTAPFTCHHSNAALGSDPSPGFQKACFVYPN